MSADNALANQSSKHPDGWGVAYYIGNSPHIIRSPDTALDDKLFHKVSGIVSSQSVIAHIRKSTQGPNTVLNTHPFQFGKWTFAHNGNIKDFESHRSSLKELVDKRLRPFILGETDSEILFFIFLTNLSEKLYLHTESHRIDDIIHATKSTVEKVTKIIGDHTLNDSDPPQETFLTFIVSDGKNLLTYQGGKNVNYSTYKTRCDERNTCTSFSAACEAPSLDGRVNHLIFSSEPLQGENIWIPMKPKDIVAIDSDMKVVLDAL